MRATGGILPTQFLRFPAGLPLDPASRRLAESLPGTGDYSRVRIHSDPAAASVADHYRASALTVGQDIFFGHDQYRLNTSWGQRLLAHELIHTAQQRNATPAGGLEEAECDHPLERNAHAVLAEGAQPASAPHAVVARQSIDEPLPPVSLSRPKERPSVMKDTLGFHLLPDDKQAIRNFLALGHLLVGAAMNPVFEGRDTTLDEITDRTRNLVLPIIPRTEASTFVTGVWLGVLVNTTELPPLRPAPIIVPPESGLPGKAVPPPGPQSTPDVLSDWQVMAGGQWAYHLNSRDPASTTVQVQFSKGSGPGQFVFQYQVDVNTGAVQYMGGVQVQASAETKKLERFIGAVVQGQVFLQLLYGLTQARGEAWGDVTFQIQAGAQVTAVWQKSKVSVSVQLGPSVTFQGTQSPAFDFNVAPAGGGTGTLQGGTPQPGFFGISGRF